VSKARGIAEARWYGHSGRYRRHERKIVRQFEQVGDGQGESNIPMKRDIALFTEEHLRPPLTYQGVLIKDHGETSQFLRI
jgi:hypothetical protein